MIYIFVYKPDYENITRFIQEMEKDTLFKNKRIKGTIQIRIKRNQKESDDNHENGDKLTWKKKRITILQFAQ